MSLPRVSLLSGMSQTSLQAALANAQQAYLDLSTGVKVEVAGYSQGDGNKAVTYTKADMPALTSLIKELQTQLGIITRARQPIRFRFR